MNDTLLTYGRLLSQKKHLVLLLYLLTTFQGCFLLPYVMIVPGVRTNLFTALLGGACLAGVWLWRKPAWNVRSVPCLVSLALLAALVALSFTAHNPTQSLYRNLFVGLSAFSGFWAARLLFDCTDRLRLLATATSWLFVLLCATCTLGEMLHDDPLSLTGLTNPHPLANTFFFLSIGPISLIASRRADRALAGLSMLFLATAILFACKLKIAALFPLMLSPMAFLFRLVPTRAVFPSIAVAAALTVFFFQLYPHKALRLHREQASYHHRLENYFFSAGIIEDHPLTGIGLRAPRDEYARDYVPRVPQVTPESFQKSTKYLVTAENMYLTMLSGLGIPFTLAYLAAILPFLWRSVKWGISGQPDMGLHPASIALPLLAITLHMLVDDSLMHTQTAWQYHSLLALIPFSGAARTGA